METYLKIFEGFGVHRLGFDVWKVPFNRWAALSLGTYIVEKKLYELVEFKILNMKNISNLQ